MKLFSGSSHPKLAQQITDCLTIDSAKCQLKKFANNETSVEIRESGKIWTSVLFRVQALLSFYKTKRKQRCTGV